MPVADAYQPCNDCRLPVGIVLDRCPHCGRPGLFPNVALASISSEVAALQARYDAACTDAEARGSLNTLKDFEAEVVRDGKVVISRSFDETFRLAASENELYASFYELEGTTRAVQMDDWSTRRRRADAAVFRGMHVGIRFGAVSLDERGLPHYGDCVWVLADTMVAHRTSLFEENSVLFVEARVPSNEPCPAGFRAPWEARGRLCATKTAPSLKPDTPRGEFADLLLHAGPTRELDQFVEAHVFGPITVRTISRVRVDTQKVGDQGSRNVTLRENLARANVEIVDC